MTETAGSDEAAAVATAIARFEVDTAPAASPEAAAIGPWQRAALTEGVGAKSTVQDPKGGARWLS